MRALNATTTTKNDNIFITFIFVNKIQSAQNKPVIGYNFRTLCSFLCGSIVHFGSRKLLATSITDFGIKIGITCARVSISMCYTHRRRNGASQFRSVAKSKVINQMKEHVRFQMKEYSN